MEPPGLARSLTRPSAEPAEIKTSYVSEAYSFLFLKITFLVYRWTDCVRLGLRGLYECSTLSYILSLKCKHRREMRVKEEPLPPQFVLMRVVTAALAKGPFYCLTS